MLVKKMERALRKFVAVEQMFGHAGQHKANECADCARVLDAMDALKWKDELPTAKTASTEPKGNIYRPEWPENPLHGGCANCGGSIIRPLPKYADPCECSGKPAPCALGGAR